MRSIGRGSAWLVALLGLGPPLAGPARAQEPASPPYAGEEARAIGALSADEVRGLLEGEGMGFARAAELNRHPGPRHVVELADPLGLSAGQRAAVAAIRDRMAARARILGAEIVRREAALDRAFAGGAIDEADLRERVAEIARSLGELRATHLVAHLETRAVLTDRQVALYDRLRGYGAGPDRHRH